jgi:hypothetical protein
MSKKNSGINDKDDASGEQSAFDGNSGISNTLNGEVLEESPETLSREDARRAYEHAKTPTKRNANIV